jgi:uncharacterized protein (DUF1810 family)
VTDPFNLARFVEAQNGAYASALAEIRAGRKESHWMWFVFPQLAGLGLSPMARRFAIFGLAEAQAFLSHGVLGARLTEIIAATLALEGLSARAIFGQPDDMKFRSSLTLFAAAAPELILFTEALAKYFDGRGDPLTLERLR